jgi:hypothetical protein
VNKWKIIGLAGVVSLAATGAVVAQRRRRQWQDYEPDEVRDQLAARFAEAGIEPTDVSPRQETTQ